MDKEEILKKSRAEQTDEGQEHAMRVGSNWAYIGMFLMYLTLIALIMGLDWCSIAENGHHILEDGIHSISLAPVHGMFWFGKGLWELGSASVRKMKGLRFSGIISTVMGVLMILLYVVHLAMSIGTGR